MKVARLFLLQMVVAAGCQGELGLDESSVAADQLYPPCTETLKCCSKEEMKCTGDPDKGMVCTCAGLWDCSKNPKKCEQDMQVPGDGSWTCSWTDSAYTCVGKPASGTTPGGGGWTCAKKGNSWECIKSPPNPSNKPEGGSVWRCTVDNELDKIFCEAESTPPPSTPPSTPPPSTPPGGGTPSGSDAPPWLPPWTPQAECKPGQKMWCDGEVYCGWGQVVCGPDGMWKRKGFLGLGGLDCQELADGRRPNTVCACYHTYFNEKCCETPDCIVPPGANGQICPASPGALCDYCNAQAEGGCVEAGGHCIVTNSGETFCGKGCSSAQPCPPGYDCMSLSTTSGPTTQCVPADLSCFF
jgi:hypothetical protein